jgi:hypothetical protein
MELDTTTFGMIAKHGVVLLEVFATIYYEYMQRIMNSV